MAKSSDRIDRYRLLRRLEVGGLGEIWLAEEEPHRRIVLIHKLFPFVLENTDFIDHFRETYRLERELIHDNIVGTYDCNLHPDAGVVAKEYVPGRNLAQMRSRAHQERRWPSEQFVTAIGVEICRALEYAGCVHRDLSPQHVLLSWNGGVKIFEFSRPILWRTGAGILKGQFAHMSPEQIMGEKLDVRTDIFTIGTLLWELLARRRLFYRDSALETLNAIRDAVIPRLTDINPSVSPELAAIVHRALARRRDARHQTPEELRLALEERPVMPAHERSQYLSDLFRDTVTAQELRLPKRTVFAPGTFEACVAAEPALADPYLVYADWLQQKGDPRGEVIMLDHLLRNHGTLSGHVKPVRNHSGLPRDAKIKAQMARESALFDEHRASLLTGLELVSPVLSGAVWKNGFITEVTLLLGRDRAFAHRAIEALAAAPATRFLRVLRIDNCGGALKGDALDLERLACLERLVFAREHGDQIQEPTFLPMAQVEATAPTEPAHPAD